MSTSSSTGTIGSTSSSPNYNASLAITNAPPIYQSVEELAASANFGNYGGRYIPETLMAAHAELEKTYVDCTADPLFREELELLGRDYIGRPTPLYYAKRLSETIGGAQIYLKREELAFTGSHKINNALGQVSIYIVRLIELYREGQTSVRFIRTKFIMDHIAPFFRVHERYAAYL
jgi:hypothetical protein